MCVHRVLGPGLLESTYEKCLEVELAQAGLRHERQLLLPILYRGHRIESAFRVDFMVEGCVVVELKAVNQIDPVHIAQLLTYLKLSGCTAGLLINFNVALLKDGIRRLVLNHAESPRAPRLPSFR